MGAQRLHRHLRRLPPARRPARRPARAAADPGDGYRPVRRRVAGRRAGPELRHAGRRPARRGTRRRADVAGRAVHPHHALQLRHRPGEGTRRLGSHGRHGLGRRGLPRRRPVRGAGLALGALREPAGLRAGPRRRVPAHRRRPGRIVRRKGTASRHLRHARRRPRHRRDAAADLRAGARARRRLGRGKHGRRTGGGGRAPARVLRERSAATLPARAAVDLPAQGAGGGQHVAGDRDGRVLLRVLLHHAVHAERARLLPHAGRAPRMSRSR